MEKKKDGNKSTPESLDSYRIYSAICIDNGKLVTWLYDKRNDFNFTIVNFPFLSSNIPSAPAYGVYVSQLVHYARSCCEYQGFAY